MAKRNRGKILLWVIVCLVLAAGGVVGARAVHVGQLAKLFEGELVDKSEHRQGYYPTVVYDLTEYTKKESDKKEDDTDASEFHNNPDDDDEAKRGIDSMHYTGGFVATSAATRIARLRSPSVYKAGLVPRSLTLTYPKQNALFPPNLCSPFVEWNDIYNNLWQVTISTPGAEGRWKFITSEKRWRIPDDVWEVIKSEKPHTRMSLRIKGVKHSGMWSKEKRDKIHASQVVTFSISQDEADNAIVYRMVSPPFINKKTPDMFVRDIRKKRDQLFLSARQQYCINCHTFSSKAGDKGKLGLQIRYLGQKPQKNYVYFAFYDIEKETGHKAILPWEIQMTTFMGWSPDGTKLAFSANQALATLSPIVYETQFATQTTSDIAVYDTTTQEVFLLPGACEDDILEMYPFWTPDSKSIVFSWDKSGKHPTETRFNISIIPYNNGKGGKPRTIRAVNDNGMSNYYPRFSPDGRWFSFVRSKYGSLIKASSDIYIMDAKPILEGDLGGKATRLECNTKYTADSWRSWSSNSKWMVFASKRDDGIFARLYMTHIDDDGHASEAVRLPIENPRTRSSFNIPEFVKNVPPIDEKTLFAGVGVDAEVVNTKSIDKTANESE